MDKDLESAVNLSVAYKNSELQEKNQEILTSIISNSKEGIVTVRYPSYATNVFWQVQFHSFNCTCVVKTQAIQLKLQYRISVENFVFLILCISFYLSSFW